LVSNFIDVTFCAVIICCIFLANPALLEPVWPIYLHVQTLILKIIDKAISAMYPKHTFIADTASPLFAFAQTEVLFFTTS